MGRVQGSVGRAGRVGIANGVVGQQFGYLTVLRIDRAVGKSRHVMVVCVCVCGTETTVRRADLVAGHQTSCGCKRGKFTHGESRSPTWYSWMMMRRRCADPVHEQWPRYGGRGIRVCAEWADAKTGYQAFVRDVGHRPEGKTLDRIDVNGNYEPGNVRWTTAEEQARNKRPRGGSRKQREKEAREDAQEQAYWEAQEQKYETGQS